MPEHETPDKNGWRRLTDLAVVVDGAGKFRQFLAGCERARGVNLKIGAECISYPQAADPAKVAGWVVFVPECWWRRRKEWAARTQKFRGLEQHQRMFQLGWNKKVAERRSEVAKLVKALGGMR